MTTKPRRFQNSSSAGGSGAAPTTNAQNFSPNSAMDRAVAPPSRRNRQPLGSGRVRGGRIDAQRVLLQHVEDLRHAHDHRDAPRLDDAHDVVRVEAAHEHDRAVHHRRDVGRHRLPEHVAERQQIEKAQRQERPRVFLVLEHLALDRHDVRQHVAMADDHALGFGGGAGREDDLRDVVARDRDGRHRRVGVPVDTRRSATRRVGAGSRRGRVACATGHVVADQHDHARLDDARRP